MPDRFVVHVQLEGGHHPFDSQVIEDLNEAVEYIRDFHDGDIETLSNVGKDCWTMLTHMDLETCATYATIEKFNPAEHSELLQELPISP